MKQASLAAACIAALIVSGCVQGPIELDQKKVSTVQRVTVIGPVAPVPMAVTTQGEADAQAAMSAASAIPFAGVLGAAIAGGVAGAISAEVARETSKPLNDEVLAEKYNYSAVVEDAMVTALKADGYDVSTATVDHKSGRFAEKVDGVGDKPDLILDATAAATCSNVASYTKPAKGEKAHFRPVVYLRVKLTRPGETAPIMDKSFVYDDTYFATSAFQIKGDTKYDIADYETLKGNIKGCLDGIKASAVPLANAVIKVIADQKAKVAAK